MLHGIACIYYNHYLPSTTLGVCTHHQNLNHQLAYKPADTILILIINTFQVNTISFIH